MLLLKHRIRTSAALWNYAFLISVVSLVSIPLLPAGSLVIESLLHDFTYLMPICFLFTVRYNFKDNFTPQPFEKGLLVVLLTLLLTYKAIVPFDDQDLYYGKLIILLTIIDIVCIACAYWIVIETWSEDLDPARRRARVLHLAAIGTSVSAYFILLSAQHFLPHLMPDFAFNLLPALCVNFICFFLIVMYADLDPAIFAPYRPVSVITDISEEEGIQPVATKINELKNAANKEKVQQVEDEYKADLERIMFEMKDNERFREHDLSLAKLAIHLGIPKYRLRMTINQYLGYRNFYAFVNQFRIEAAKHALSDVTDNTPVLTISYNCGYKNLSTFNNAFRELTKKTPSQFRKYKLDRS